MNAHFRLKILFALFSGLLFVSLLQPSMVSAIQTTFNGETITWYINGIANIQFQACSSDPGPNYGCHYVAAMPAPGTRVGISAAITPADWSTWSNWLEIYNIPAGSHMTKKCDQPSSLCVPGSTMALSGTTTFANDVPVPPYTFIDSFMIVFGGSDISPFEIKLHLFNNSPFTIDARPDLLGGPEDNDCIEFTDGNQRPRWRKYRGSGPGL